MPFVGQMYTESRYTTDENVSCGQWRHGFFFEANRIHSKCHPGLMVDPHRRQRGQLPSQSKQILVFNISVDNKLIRDKRIDTSCHKRLFAMMLEYHSANMKMSTIEN